MKKVDEKEHASVLSGSYNNGVVNNEWMKNLEYEPDGFADDCDVLVVENGPLNITFIDHYTNQPMIRRVIDIVNKFNGLVIWYQTDPLLPFPFWRLTMAERPWSHSDNNVRNKVAAVEDDGWGDFSEIFGNKINVCIGKALEVEKFPDAMNGERFRYKHFLEKGLISFKYIPTGYDHHFLPHIKYDWNKKVYPMTYIGFPRSRMSSFRKFYEPFMENVHVYGPWEGSGKTEFLNEFRNIGMRWYGHAKGYIDITQMYDESLCCVNLAPGKAQDIGWITNRVFESIFCGCLVLGDKETVGISNYVPQELMVDETNIREVVKRIFESTQQEYVDLMNKQYSMVKHLNYDYIVAEFENLLQKYGEKLGDTNKRICLYPASGLIRDRVIEVRVGVKEPMVPEKELEPVTQPLPEPQSIPTSEVKPAEPINPVIEKVFDPTVPVSFSSKWCLDKHDLELEHNNKMCVFCDGFGTIKTMSNRENLCPACKGSGYKQNI
jgi:hypothetical protein